MQQPVSRRDVYSPSLSARVGGRDVELASASMDRSLPDPLAGGSLTAASGELVAVEGADVAQIVATPWDPASSWPPAPEAPASALMDTGAGPVSILGNGRVVSASGGTSGREVSVEVSDAYQSLDKTISWDELSAMMPSESEGVEGRYVGLQTVSVTDMILRHCGWFSTPPNPGFTALSVPAQGTMWPETGTVVSAVRASDGGGYPGWSNTPWGVGVVDSDATYLLGGPGYSVKSRGRVELTAMTAPRPGEGTSRIDLMLGGALLARLLWSESTAYVQLRNAAGTMTNAVSVPRANGLLYATVEYVSDTSVYVTIRSGGQTVGAAATVPALVTTSAITGARIQALSVSGGFRVAFPSAAGLLESWSPNAVLYPRTASRNTLLVRPPVSGENCADLLAAQCAAECATYWIDETGVLRWWDLARLESRGAMATLHSDDDIAEAGFSWSHDLSRVKSRVSVTWREPLREASWRTRVDLWQGSGQTLQPGPEENEEWLNVPDDEVWIMPDISLLDMSLASNMGDFNNGIGSFYGGVIPGAGSLPDRWARLDGNLSVSVERVTGASFKMRTTWNGSEQAIQRTPDEDTDSGLWRRRRDSDLPIIRGKMKYTLSDRETFSAQNGPVSAPEHRIDAGWWIQSDVQAQWTADYAGARLTVPQPVLSSVALIPVPGLQLGDMVEVRDEHVTRLTARGIVVEDSRSIDAGMGLSHSVAIRPVAVSRNGVTWQEWASVAAPKTWSEWATSEGGTWQQWGTNPLNN